MANFRLQFEEAAGNKVPIDEYLMGVVLMQ